MKNIQAIILAAGKGTRLNNGRPSIIPKAMFKLNGKPMVEYIIETLQKIGIKKPIMVVGYEKEIIKKYFGKRCEYVWQKKQLGTGHAAWQGVKILPASLKNILVIQADDSAFYKPQTLQRLIENQQKNDSVLVLLTVYKESKDLGRMVKNKKGEVVDIIEKEFMTPELYKKHQLVNCGGYCFDVKWAKRSFPRLKKNKTGRYDLPDMIKIAVRQGEKVLDLEIDPREWIGINTLEQYEEAKKMIK